MNDASARLAAVEDIIGHRFARPELLARALTHSSAKGPEHPSNERLEFLGDSVLGLIIAEYVFRDFEDAPEGELTRIKSAVVSAKTLGNEIRRLQLGRALEVGPGIRKNNTVSDSMRADMFEAIVGALYLDAGLETARAWILKELQHVARAVVEGQRHTNWKSALQHLTQRRYAATPRYILEEASGPDHEPVFQVAVHIQDELRGRGQGPTKKTAEQAAARDALLALEAEDDREEKEGADDVDPASGDE